MDKTESLRYPLSRSQRSIWAGQQLSPKSPLYNMAHTFDLYGQVSVEYFSLAFQHLIDHFEAYRIVFGLDEQHEPCQTILPKFHYSIEYIDLSESDQQEKTYTELIKKKSQINFSLDQPPFYACLIKKKYDHFVWFFNAHHLITDITSIKISYDKIAKYYEMLCDGEKINEPPSSYIDYIKYEAKCITDSNKEKFYKYWNQKKATAPSILKLYGQEKDINKTSSLRLKIPAETNQLEKLRELIGKNPYRSFNDDLSYYTLFSTLLAAFIYKLTSDTNITIGSPTFNRPRKDFQTAVGLFIEVLPFGVTIDEHESFRSLFEKVRKSIYELVGNIVPGASSSELNRGISVILNYIPTKFGSFGKIPAQMTWIHPDHIDNSHQLRLQVFDFNGEGLELNFDVNTSVLSENQIKYASQHFLKLIKACLDKPETFLSSINLVSEKEQIELNEKVNFGINAASETGHFLASFRQCLIQHSNRIAINDDEADLTYQQLDEKSNQFANLLGANGVGSNHRVAIHLKRSVAFVVSVLGTLKAGAAYTPIPVDYPSERVKKILADVSPSMVITDTSSIIFHQDSIPTFHFSLSDDSLEDYSKKFDVAALDINSPAYVMYTSGSTGNPKGAVITHRSLENYIQAAKEYYANDSPVVAPLFTSIGFDLTVTSIYLPLISGGSIRVYEEDESGHDLSILKVIEDSTLNFIKLTPSHARLIADLDLSQSNIATMILGGENLDAKLAGRIYSSFGGNINIFNEYGPTEATVGCIVKKYNPKENYGHSVPIGLPFGNATAFILDNSLNMVPEGAPGELYVGGPGLSTGYWHQTELSNKSFVKSLFAENELMYKTGDLARLNDRGEIEYLGRIDRQLKIGGVRVESSEIESLLTNYPGINQVVINHYEQYEDKFQTPDHYCTKCGLPSNYPNASFNEEGICDLCLSFDTYQKNVSHYFGELEALKSEMQQARIRKKGKFDCLMLLSGGKDSSYALAQLVDMKLDVLAFTLENGYISDEAKQNIRTVVDALGVDHIYGTTDYMNQIFVDSLQRFSNVCNGCFKTLYTLSTQKALELGIPVIVTGLSRGQFFETRLTEELFRKKQFEVADIDKTILDARRAYHRIPDAVSKYLDVSMFQNDEVFDQVQFVDFYRYCDVNLSEMMDYLNKRLNWVRPSDTGRSTNCLINDLGIYMHKKERGYHNYSFPYSWDVRMGHKRRDEALEELNDQIDEKEIQEMLNDIGYPIDIEGQKASKQLIVYYSSEQIIESAKLKNYLMDFLPSSVIPAKFIQVNQIPINNNGKIDLNALSALNQENQGAEIEYIAPRNDIEEVVSKIWEEVFQINQISVHSLFLEMGGSSLLAIRIISRVNEQLHLDLNVSSIFRYDSIAKFSSFIESKIEELLNNKTES